MEEADTTPSLQAPRQPVDVLPNCLEWELRSFPRAHGKLARSTVYTPLFVDVSHGSVGNCRTYYLGRCCRSVLQPTNSTALVRRSVRMSMVCTIRLVVPVTLKLTSPTVL